MSEAIHWIGRMQGWRGSSWGRVVLWRANDGDGGTVLAEPRGAQVDNPPQKFTHISTKS